MSQARGVILLAAVKANLIICEYTPLQVKITLTGYGRADKKRDEQRSDKRAGRSKRDITQQIATTLRATDPLHQKIKHLLASPGGEKWNQALKLCAP